MKSYSMTDTAPLVPITGSLIMGIVAGYHYPVDELYSLMALATGVAIALLLYRRPRWQTAVLWLCPALLGLHLSSRQLRTVHTLPQGHDLIIASEPTDKGKTVVMDALTPDGKKVRLHIMKGGQLHVGDGITVSRDIRPINYYPLYFDSHGYSGEVFAGRHEWQGRQVSMSQLSHLQRTRLQLLRLRSRLTGKYRDMGLADDSYAVIAAMTLGDKSALSAETRDTYVVTGASHILALSGLHLGIIYWLITLLIPGRRWRMASQMVTVLAIWAFAFLTGLSPSVIRSAVMLTVYALLAIGYRDRASVNVLAFTALVMLVVNPLTVFDIGFQMSFLAVLGILLFHPLFYRLLPLPFLQRHLTVRWPWAMVCLSLAAQLGVAPLIAFYFHRFSCYFLLSNFIVVPCAYAILIGALLLLLTSLAPVATCLTAIVTLMGNALGHVAHLPFASIDGLHSTLLQTVLLYAATGCLYIVLRHTVGRRQPVTD